MEYTRLLFLSSSLSCAIPVSECTLVAISTAGRSSERAVGAAHDRRYPPLASAVPGTLPSPARDALKDTLKATLRQYVVVRG